MLPGIDCLLESLLPVWSSRTVEVIGLKTDSGPDMKLLSMVRNQGKKMWAVVKEAAGFSSR